MPTRTQRDRAAVRDAADLQRARGAGDRERRRVLLLVGAEHRRDDLHVVAEVLGEERPHRAVDHPARDDRGLARPALAAGERPGDAPRRRRASPRSRRSAGRSRCPLAGAFDATAVTRITVSPQRSITAPFACSAMYPVSTISARRRSPFQMFSSDCRGWPRVSPRVTRAGYSSASPRSPWMRCWRLGITDCGSRCSCGTAS